MGRIWAIASGNGGTGKTTISLSLAAEASSRGQRTILLDASGIGRSCDLILGLEGMISMDLLDVLTQQTEIQSALYPVPGFERFSIAVSSLSQDIPLEELSGMILALQSMCDVLIIDLPTGVLPPEKAMMTPDDAILIVLRPDDPSIRAAERLIRQSPNVPQLALVINRIRRDRVKKGFQYQQDAVAMTLDCPVIGAIQEDDQLASSIARTKSLSGFLSWGYNPIRDIARQLLRQ